MAWTAYIHGTVYTYKDSNHTLPITFSNILNICSNVRIGNNLGANYVYLGIKWYNNSLVQFAGQMSRYILVIGVI